MKIDEIEYNRLIKQIKTRCKPWLAESNNGQLVVYRGLRYNPYPDQSAYFVSHQVDKTRQPVDSPIAVQNYYNETITKAGKKANRSNSVFTLGSTVTLKNQAETFGEFKNFVVVVPIGKFNYTWSTLFADGYKFYENNLTQYTEFRNGIRMITEIPPELDNKIIKSWRGDDGSLAQAIRRRHEIMIHANAVYYIKPEIYRRVKKDLESQSN